MRVIDHLADFEKTSQSVVTIGTFDGVHVGHQTILKQVVEEAKKVNGVSVLITFWPHPRFVLSKDPSALKLLSTFDEKVKLVEELGVDYLLKIPFTPEFSNLSASEFVERVLIEKVGTKKLFIGYDHHFGNNREGNIEFLKTHASDYDFEVHEISRQDIDDIGVSSTKIRKALEAGEIPHANSLLGRNYSMCGRVIHGDKKGRQMGFPTANIEIEESYKLLPSDGAYAAYARLEGQVFPAMLNIGFKPTVEGRDKTIEAHLFNFEGDIYDQQMTIEFVELLRKEVKFSSLGELQRQLEQDKLNALKILS